MPASESAPALGSHEEINVDEQAEREEIFGDYDGDWSPNEAPLKFLLSESVLSSFEGWKVLTQTKNQFRKALSGAQTMRTYREAENTPWA